MERWKVLRKCNTAFLAACNLLILLMQLHFKLAKEVLFY
jgi:hypothetical protein